jgi:hypothetical protein
MLQQGDAHDERSNCGATGVRKWSLRSHRAARRHDRFCADFSDAGQRRRIPALLAGVEEAPRLKNADFPLLRVGRTCRCDNDRACSYRLRMSASLASQPFEHPKLALTNLCPRVKVGCLSEENTTVWPPEADRDDRPGGPHHVGSGNAG